MMRDWLAACFAGSLCLFFGTMWLYKEMIMVGSAINVVILPPWTCAYLYNRYNLPGSTLFTTWWYFCVLMVQFFGGLMAMYLYAYLKVDLEARERESCIKQEQGPIALDCTSIKAQPCGCTLIGNQMQDVVNRYNNLHELDVRANILCPSCKNRVDFLGY